MSGDPYWSKVVFLSSFDGAAGATTGTDDSNSAHAMTFNGNAQIDTAQSKAGGASLLLDGTGDYCSCANSPDWDLSDANSDQFTVECFIRPHAAGNKAIISQGDFSSRRFSWMLQFTSSNLLNFEWSSTGATVMSSGVGGTPMSLDGSFYHVAVDKDSVGSIRLYVDGVMTHSVTPTDSSFFNSTDPLFIGTDFAGRGFNGWIDELRITKGVARYASDAGFIVPTAPFPRAGVASALFRRSLSPVGGRTGARQAVRW